VAALSVDDRQTTAALVDKHQLTFPVGYGADAAAVAALTGAFVNPEAVYLQSTGFVLDPAGKVVVTCQGHPARAVQAPRMNSVMDRPVGSRATGAAGLVTAPGLAPADDRVAGVLVFFTARTCRSKP
jgi:hypothetical protein